MSEIPASEIPASEIPGPDWYTEFFTELPSEFWRRAAPPESAEADIDFVERQLGLSPGSRVVDVPCGSGRHSLVLAARGHVVTGIDISTEAIAHARQAAAEAELDIDLAIADMRDIPRGKNFDRAICMGNSFGYLEIGGVRKFLARVAAALAPGGGMVIDFNAAAETILPGFRGDPRTMHTGDITVQATTDYDIAGSRLISGYRFSRGFTGDAGDRNSPPVRLRAARTSRNCCPMPVSPTSDSTAGPTVSRTSSVLPGCC